MNPDCNCLFQKNEVQYQIKIYHGRNPIYGGIICVNCYDDLKKMYLACPKICGHYNQDDEIVITISPPKKPNRLTCCSACFAKFIKPEQMLLEWGEFSFFIEQKARKIIMQGVFSEISKRQSTKKESCISYKRLAEIFYEENGFSIDEFSHSAKCKKCAAIIAYLQALTEAVQETKQNSTNSCPPARELVLLVLESLLSIGKHENKIGGKSSETSRHTKKCPDCKEYIEEIINKTSEKKYFFQNH